MLVHCKAYVLLVVVNGPCKCRCKEREEKRKECPPCNNSLRVLLSSVAKLQKPEPSSFNSYPTFCSVEGWQNMLIDMSLEQLWVCLVNGKFVE